MLSKPGALTLLVVVVALLSCLQGANAAIAEHKIKSIPNINGNVGEVELKSDQYSGYLTLSNKNYSSFYYFIESQSNPSTDPLVLWLNGGPGCSSLLGLFTEIGPYIIRRGGKFEYNPNSWTTKANVLFLEAPPGVGFSMDNNSPKTNWTDEKTAQANYNFLSLWLTKYPEYKNRKMILTGESYAGHYVPQLASQILHGGDQDLKAMMHGFMVGNPCTGDAIGGGLDWCFTAVDPTLSEYFKSHAFMSYDDRVPNTDVGPYGWPQANYDPYDILERNCRLNLEETVVRWDHTLFKSKKNANSEEVVMELNKGGGVEGYGPCSEEYLQVWLNRKDVRQALHADLAQNANKKWEMCSSTMIYPTPTTLPGVLPLYNDFMTNTNWDLMIYSGDADTVVNFIQSEKIVASLNRPVLSNFTPWYYQDQYNYTWSQMGGWYTWYDRLSWASVKGAGHMAPTMQPGAMLQLLTSFLSTGRPGLAPTLLPYNTSQWPEHMKNPGAKEKCNSTDNGKISVAKEVELVGGGALLGIILTMTIVLIYRHTLIGKGRSSLEDDDSSKALHGNEYGSGSSARGGGGGDRRRHTDPLHHTSQDSAVPLDPIYSQ